MLAAALAALAAAAPGAGPDVPPDGWARTIVPHLSRADVDLSPRASVTRLARAAVAREATRLGLADANRLRVASRFPASRSAGGRPLRTVRFQQTASGVRVVWSQIDVTVAGGEVTSLSATVVPAAGRVASGALTVGRARALRIARRVAPRARAVVRPLRAAYAGWPSRERRPQRRRAVPVWVVELELPARGDGASSALCVVIDARSAKVIARWPGVADRPDRGRDRRGASVAAAAAAVDPRTRPSYPLAVYDATGKNAPPPLAEDLYAEFHTSGNTRVGSSWPSYLDARDDFAEPSADMDAVTANAANVARTICTVRGWCGMKGGWQPDATRISPWVVMGNTTGGSHTSPGTLYVWIGHDSIARGNGDPNRAFNDVVAHEFGHVMDLVYAGDRFPGNQFSPEGKEVQEALANMFAYDYDREDATGGEETIGGTRVDWAVPGRISLGGQPYPAHMRDYDKTPPEDRFGNPYPHFNASILSHAYYELVRRLGHHQSGRVLHNIPATLSPFPTFREVARGFVVRAGEIYPQDGPDAGTRSDAREAAEAAFDEVGLHVRDHRT
jgi:Zn-dependent metalloprotease